MMIGNLGPTELILILAVVLLLFGGRKIPEIAKSLAMGIKEFKKASKDVKKEISDAKKIEEDEPKEK